MRCGLTLGFSRRWKRSAANPCWGAPRLCLPGPDLQRLQYFKADLLSDSECWPVLIPHHRHTWKTLLRHGDTARPERPRIIRWHKDIRQAHHIVRVMSDGASHQCLILVGDDEDNLWIGQQGWKKDTRLLGGWSMRWAAAPRRFPLCQFGRALDPGPVETGSRPVGEGRERCPPQPHGCKEVRDAEMSQ